MLNEAEMSDDSVVPYVYESTEEGQKVTRNHGNKFMAVFQRTENPPPD